MTNPPVRQHQIYPDDFPPSWASDYGEDEYGLWLAFKYKGVEQRFRWCEPGVFIMGSPVDEPGRFADEIQHEVTLTRGFWIGEVPVTQALWKVFMGDNPSSFNGEQRPVERLSWNEAQRFIQTLNGLKLELGLRLPTEAEWEYACRAGTSSVFHFGDQITPNEVNYNGNRPYHNGKPCLYRKQTVAVRELPCNSWGLYQMHGNILEWCQDWYDFDFGFYSGQPVIDPVGPDTGVFRVLRGGSGFCDGRYCRSASRRRLVPTARARSSSFGFRLARGQ